MSTSQPPRGGTLGSLPKAGGEVTPENVHIRRSGLPGEAVGSPGKVPSPLPVPLGTGSRGTPRGDCRRTAAGRIVPGRHIDGCAGPECPGCQPCPEDHCLTCRVAHATVTCPGCLGVARDNLAKLRVLTANLAPEAVNGRQAFHTHEDIPGGDALVMMTAASVLRGRGGPPPRTHHRNRYELATDPRPPLDVLVIWEQYWRAHVGQPTGLAPTMDRVADYLDAQLHHIAQHPVFPTLAKDILHTLHRLETVLHDGYRPDLTRVPCWECGTRLAKVYTDLPRYDHYRCPSCGEHYDQARYERALHQHLASKGAARYVPVSTAIAATGRPEQTVRAWMRRELVHSIHDPSTGRLLVWWPDVRSAHFATRTRARRSA